MITQRQGKTALLVAAFSPPEIALIARELPPGEICALTGEQISIGIQANALLTDASSAPHEIFPVTNARYVSLDAARCYKDFKGGLTSNLLAIERADGTVEGYRPMRSPVSAAEKQRPLWQSVIYQTDPYCRLSIGDRTLAVVTDEAKRRLWLNAGISTLGPRWRPFLFHLNTIRSLTVDFSRLQQVLALVEFTTGLGFSPESILRSLMALTPMETIRRCGLPYTQELDHAIEPHRGTDELLLAAFIVRSHTEGLEAPEEFQCLIPPKS